MFVTALMGKCVGEQVEDLLREAMLLQEAMTKKIEAGALEKLLPRRFKQYTKGVSSRA